MMSQWHEENPQLLADITKQAREQLQEVETYLDSQGKLIIIGFLELRTNCGFPFDRVHLRFSFPTTIGQRGGEAIKVFDHAEKFDAPDPEGHINDDRSFCWGIPGESEIDFTKGGGFQHFLTALKIFFSHQYIYQKRKLEQHQKGGPPARWPGNARSHGSAGIEEAIKARGHIDADAPCPCGSGSKYRTCHMSGR